MDIIVITIHYGEKNTNIAKRKVGGGVGKKTLESYFGNYHREAAVAALGNRHYEARSILLSLE